MALGLKLSNKTDHFDGLLNRQGKQAGELSGDDSKRIELDKAILRNRLRFMRNQRTSLLQ